jgi:hypothetical protein
MGFNSVFNDQGVVTSHNNYSSVHNVEISGTLLVNGNEVANSFLGDGTITDTAYTFASTDHNKFLLFSNSSGITASIPTNASAPMRNGTFIHVNQYTSGQILFSPASGVTLLTPGGLRTRKIFSSAMIVKVATNTWMLTGDIEIS